MRPLGKVKAPTLVWVGLFFWQGAIAISASARCPVGELTNGELLSDLGITVQPRYIRRGAFRVLLESSGEIEAPIEQVISSTETTDGSIRPILMGFPPPKWFRAKYKKILRGISSTRWSDVEPEDRVRLLGDIYRLDFARREKRLDYSAWPKTLSGLTIIRSPDPNDISHYFLPDLEFVQPLTPGVVEIKCRTPLRPSETRKAMMARFPDAPSLHVHSVAPLDFDKMRQNPRREAARIVDRFMRVNLMAEMMSIIHKEYPMSPDKDLQFSSSSLKSREIKAAVSHFADLAFGKNPKFNQSLKFALVGQRTDEDYDHQGVELVPNERPAPDPVYLLGSENRFLRKGKAGIFGEFKPRFLPLVDAFLDKTQELIEDRKEDSGAKQLDRWLREHPVSDLSSAWWNQPLRDFLDQLPAHITTNIHMGPKEQEAFQRLSVKGTFPLHEEVKMLLHDWSLLPLLSGDEKLLRKIENAQVKGVRAILEGKKANSVVRAFLLESGLYKEVARSLDLEPFLPREVRRQR